MGRFDKAEELLEGALAEFREVNARNFVVETDARLAEKAVLAGDAAEGLRRCDEALRAGAEGGGSAVLSAMLHRLRGYALMQSGDLDGADDALAESRRSADAASDAESYELALTLEAAGRLAGLRGEPDGGARERSERIFRRLGVIARPAIPT